MMKYDKMYIDFISRINQNITSQPTNIVVETYSICHHAICFEPDILYVIPLRKLGNVYVSLSFDTGRPNVAG